jgi:hypothetical protein
MAKKTAEKTGPAVAFEGPDHDPRTEVDDTGDVVDPDADDPAPAEITDPADPSFVDPTEVE